jgi:hypothetical protein
VGWGEVRRGEWGRDGESGMRGGAERGVRDRYTERGKGKSAIQSAIQSSIR